MHLLQCGEEQGVLPPCVLLKGLSPACWAFCQAQHPGAAAARSAAAPLSLGADSRARAEEMQALIQRRSGGRAAFTLQQAPQVPRSASYSRLCSSH